jgi:PAS domain S-box-containing protein
MARPAQSSSIYTLLLVEDEQLIAMDERQLLERAGYSVVEAHSGGEAVDAAAADHSIDLVLMDIDLGEGPNGVEAARRILEFRELPIVFLTSHTGQYYVDLVKQVSSYGYVVKSSGEFVLLRSIEMAFELFHAHQRERQQREHYEQLLHSSEEGIVSYDREGRVLAMNDRAAAYLYGVPEDFIGKTLPEFLPEAIVERGLATVRHVFETGESVRRKATVHLHGAERHFDMRFEPIRNDEGTIHSLLHMSRDTTEEQAALEEELRESERTLRLLAENAHDVIALYDVDLTLRYVSPSVEQFGYTADELVDSGILPLVHPDDRDTVGKAIDGVLRTEEGAATMVHRVVTKSGTYVWLEVNAKRFEDEDGYTRGVVAVARDITDRKKAEEELQAALDQKDQLMQELNHRVKNNLAMVVSLIRLKQSALGDETDLSDIANQVDTIRSLHEKLQYAEDVSHVDLSPYLTDVVDSAISSQVGAEVEVDIGDVPVPTKTATTLGLIISELATNALKHGFLPGSEKRFTVSMETQENSREYVLTVSNTGREFPQSIGLETTTSLGVQLVMALVGQLGGRLQLQRTPTPVFTIRFPIPE